MAEADYYLKITDIEGEAVVEGQEQNMQIESWSFGATNSGSASIGTGMGTGKASLQDFHFVIQNGKASPKLFLACVNGDHKTEATLVCRKTGGGGSPYTYLKVTFNDLVISSFQTGGSNGSSTLPMEQISFNFAKITIEQFVQDTTSGNVTAGPSAIYDTKAVKGTAG